MSKIKGDQDHILGLEDDEESMAVIGAEHDLMSKIKNDQDQTPQSRND